MLKGWLQEADREEHLKAIVWLLTPLEKEWGEAVRETLAIVRNGAQISEAGRTLAAGLRAWKEKCQKELSEQLHEQKKQLDNEHSQELKSLEAENRQLQKQLKEMETTMAKAEEKLKEQEKHIEGMGRRIEAQNDVLAEQHYKLANIFGNSTNSTSA